MLLKVSGAYDRAAEDVNDMTATQKTWARFKTHFITAYHKLKKQSKGQVKNMMNGEIPALISDELQKVATQFDKGQHQLSIFFEEKKMLKELVEEHNKKITASEKTVKALDKNSNKGNQRNKKNYDNKNQNDGNRVPNPQIMYCNSCGRTNDPLNMSMNFPNPNPGHKWHATYRKRYGGPEANCAEA